MKPVEKTVRLSSGLTLPFLEQGDPNGTPVLFLHGVTDSMHSFDPVLPHLPDWMRAFALTQRGHGDAYGPERGYRTRDFADDVGHFLEAMEVDRVTLVGHSMGATNAQRFAIDHPSRTSALVLVGAFASYRNNAGLVEFRETELSRLQDPIDPAFAREFQASTLAAPIAPTFLDLVVRESLKVRAHVWRAVFDGFFEDDFAQELGDIQAPTLLVWGDRDALSHRPDQDIALRTIPRADLQVYEGSGHAVHWERPARFAQDVCTFVRERLEPRCIR